MSEKTGATAKRRERPLADSRKEKKRKLILSDSESSKEYEQNGNSSGADKRSDFELEEGPRVDEKIVEVEADGQKSIDEKVRAAEKSTDSNAVKQIEKETHDEEELSIDKERPGTDERKATEIEKNIVSVSSDAVEQQQETGTDNGISVERRKHGDARKNDTDKSMLSDAVKQREEGDTDQREVTEKRKNEDGLEIDKKRSMPLDADKQRRQADADKNKATERGKHGVELKTEKSQSVPSHATELVDQAGTEMKITADKWNSREELKVDKKVALRSDATKQREESGSNKKKATEKLKGEKKLKSNKNTVRSDAAMQRQDADTDIKQATERKKGELLKVSEKRAMSLDATVPWEEVDSSKSKAADRTSKEELRNDKRSIVRSDVAKYKEEARIHKKVSEGWSSELVLKAEKKSTTGFDTPKQREQADTDKKKSAAEKGCMKLVSKELKYDMKKAAKQDNTKQREEAGNNKNKAMKIRIYDKLKIDKKRGMGTYKVKEEVCTEEKQVTALGPENETYRKRGREDSDAEISLKRIQTDLKNGQDRTKEMDVKKMKFLKHGDQRTEEDHALGPKQIIPAGRQSDGMTENNSLVNLDNAIKSGSEKDRWREHSGQRTLRKLKDTNASSGGNKRRASDMSKQKNGTLHGKGGGMTLRPSNKKVGGLEEVHIQREDEEKVKTFTSPMSSNISNLCTTPKHPSLSGGKIVLAKPSSTLIEKHKFREIKREPKTSSPAPKNVGMSRRKHNTVNKAENNSTVETSRSTKRKKARGNRSTIRQRIRDQIKDILLNAGWKIDLRPRRGRDYEDQVYIPPTGAAGYWSITKAYDVFQKQSNHAPDDGNNKISRKSSKKLSGKYNKVDVSGSSSSAVPMELLSMLRKNIVKKRKENIEVEETQGGRSKRAKETTKMKRLKSTDIKNISGGIRGRKKLNISVYSRSKGFSEKSNTKQRGCSLLVRGANQEVETEYDDYLPYIWKRTVLSWMIDLGTVPINGKVIYGGKKQKHFMLEGRVTRDGIRCSCCSKIITVSKFEIHAGSKLHQPYQNIFLESGMSLLQCLLDTWEKQDASERQGFYTLDIQGDDPNDDTCGICGDGGDLMCCDGCPSTFHKSCLGIEMLPSGDWLCSNCLCKFCGLISEASDLESDAPASPLLYCYQCEKNYHLECVPKEDTITSSNDSFCGRSCRKLFKRLQQLVGVKTDLEAGYSLRVIRRLVEDSPLSSFKLPQRTECNAKIAVALAVMDECFLPIIDPRSGINLIHNVVYNCGSNFNRLNYNGFYTFVLERGEEIISAASIRIHGTRLAEMPFIGTRNMYRRQGMCRRLLNAIEAALCSLGIQKLIIPAIAELMDTWTTVFGFKPLKTSHKREIKSVNMLVFPGVGLLQKSLVREGSSGPSVKDDKIGPRIKHHPVPEVAADSSMPSSIVPNLYASQDATAHAEKSHPALLCSLHSISDVTPESEFQTPEHKSPECATEGSLSVHPIALYQHEANERNRVQVDSLAAPKTILLCKSNVHDNHDVKIEDAEIVSNSHRVEKASEHASKDKCMSAVATACTLRDAGTLDSCKLSCLDNTLLPQSSEAYTASTLQDFDGKDLQMSASSGEHVFVAAHINRSDVTSTFTPLCSVGPHLQASGECIVNGDVELEDQVPTLQHKLKATHDKFENCNSEILTGTMSSITNKYGTTSTECRIHTICDGTMNPIEEVKAQLAAVKSKPDANDEDAKPYTTELVSGSHKVPLGKESQLSSGNSVTHVSDFITTPICTASGNGLQISVPEKPTQQDSELVPYPLEVLNPDLSFASQRPQHRVHESDYALQLCSHPEPDVSFKNCL